MTPKKVVALIVKDLSSRKGLGDEWDQLEPEIKNEIMECWKDIVACISS